MRVCGLVESNFKSPFYVDADRFGDRTSKFPQSPVDRQKYRVPRFLIISALFLHIWTRTLKTEYYPKKSGGIFVANEDAAAFFISPKPK